jgi:Kdo2-lipid IVA lauroyltransferase/acyltransferase
MLSLPMTRDKLRHSAGSAAAGLLFRLPRFLTPRSAARLTPGLGSVMRRLDWSGRRVLDNLRTAFGDELDERERRRLASRFYGHMASLLCEMTWLGEWDRDRVMAQMLPTGMPHLWGALEGGKGAILISGHVGNWELAAARLVYEGFPVMAVIRKHRDSPLSLSVRRSRERHGVQVVQDTNPKECLRWLRKGGVVVLLVDRRDTTGSGVCVPFFGKAACSVTGPAWLALNLDAPVLNCGSWRRPDGVLEAVIEAPLPLLRTGDAERDVWLNTAQYQLAVEQLIRRHPEQWIWHRPRWRLSPTEPGALYEEMVAAKEPARSLAAFLGG